MRALHSAGLLLSYLAASLASTASSSAACRLAEVLRPCEVDDVNSPSDVDSAAWLGGTGTGTDEASELTRRPAEPAAVARARWGLVLWPVETMISGADPLGGSCAHRFSPAFDKQGAPDCASLKSFQSDQTERAVLVCRRIRACGRTLVEIGAVGSGELMDESDVRVVEHEDEAAGLPPLPLPPEPPRCFAFSVGDDALFYPFSEDGDRLLVPAVVHRGSRGWACGRSGDLVEALWEGRTGLMSARAIHLVGPSESKASLRQGAACVAPQWDARFVEPAWVYRLPVPPDAQPSGLALPGEPVLVVGLAPPIEPGGKPWLVGAYAGGTVMVASRAVRLTGGWAAADALDDTGACPDHLPFMAVSTVPVPLCEANPQRGRDPLCYELPPGVPVPASERLDEMYFAGVRMVPERPPPGLAATQDRPVWRRPLHDTAPPGQPAVDLAVLPEWPSDSSAVSPCDAQSSLAQSCAAIEDQDLASARDLVRAVAPLSSVPAGWAVVAGRAGVGDALLELALLAPGTRPPTLADRFTAARLKSASGRRASPRAGGRVPFLLAAPGDPDLDTEAWNPGDLLRWAARHRERTPTVAALAAGEAWLELGVHTLAQREFLAAALSLPAGDPRHWRSDLPVLTARLDALGAHVGWPREMVAEMHEHCREHCAASPVCAPAGLALLAEWAEVAAPFGGLRGRVRADELADSDRALGCVRPDDPCIVAASAGRAAVAALRGSTWVAAERLLAGLASPAAAPGSARADVLVALFVLFSGEVGDEAAARVGLRELAGREHTSLTLLTLSQSDAWLAALAAAKEPIGLSLALDLPDTVAVARAATHVQACEIEAAEAAIVGLRAHWDRVHATIWPDEGASSNGKEGRRSVLAGRSPREVWRALASAARQHGVAPADLGAVGRLFYGGGECATAIRAENDLHRLAGVAPGGLDLGEDRMWLADLAERRSKSCLADVLAGAGELERMEQSARERILELDVDAAAMLQRELDVQTAVLIAWGQRARESGADLLLDESVELARNPGCRTPDSGGAPADPTHRPWGFVDDQIRWAVRCVDELAQDGASPDVLDAWIHAHPQIELATARHLLALSPDSVRSPRLAAIVERALGAYRRTNSLCLGDDSTVRRLLEGDPGRAREAAVRAAR